MERVYAGHLCYGPPIEEGFYYDMFSDEYRVRNLQKLGFLSTKCLLTF